MRTLKTDTFSIDVPEFFEDDRVIFESIRIENNSQEHKFQNPEAILGLGDQSFYDQYPGDSFFERYAQHIHEFHGHVEILEEESIKKEANEKFLQVAKLSWDNVEVINLKAIVLIDDGFLYEMSAFCEEDHWEALRHHFIEVWESLVFWGDPEDALRRQNEGLETLTSSHRPPKAQIPESKAFMVPNDGQDFFHVLNTPLDFRCETKVEVSDQLSVTLKAEMPEPLKGREDLVDEYDVENGVGFRLNFSGIHKRGIPTGKFDFEFGKSENRSVYLWDDGWEYGLEFTGLVELKEGWIGMSGYLGKSYDDSICFEINLAKKLPYENLDWSEYHFSSLQETEGRAPEDIRHLYLETPTIETLPENIFGFSELRELWVSKLRNTRPEPDRLNLGILPDRFDELKKLESLHLDGTQIASLPPSFGQLNKLKSLALTQCELQSIPDSVWKLPSLQRLTLSDNKLVSLPSEINLPMLSYCNLTGNQLDTLPSSLALQGNLQSLLLTDNPLKSLPSEFNQIPTIELPIEEKQRLLDYEYPDIEPWDDEVYFARDDVRLRQVLETSDHAEALLKVTKGALVFEHDDEEDYSELGNTRFGGWPDLPKDLPYPRFGENENEGKSDYVYEFLAQLDCAALASFQKYLPREGTLYFFLDTVHEMSPKVVYWNGTKKELVSGKGLLFEENDFFEHDPPYQAYKVKVRKNISIPCSYAAYVNGFQFEGAEELLEPEDLLESLESSLDMEERPPDFHEVNSYVFTQHECPEMQASLKHKGKPQDWVVLLKVASIGHFQWWDAGELFFVIHKSDLAKKDFSRIFCGLESS